MKKVLLSLFSTLMGFIIGIRSVEKNMSKDIRREQELSDKHFTLFLLMNQWVKVKQEGKHLADYMRKNNFRTIAIYGMSYTGERLLNELRDSDIIIKYGIDRNADGIYADVELVFPEDVQDNIDAIIVTSITYVDEIKKELLNKVSCPIISLEDILYEM